MFNTYTPDGFGNVNPYLFTENPQELIDYLQKVFDAKEINRSINPKNGDISNCILQMGDSCFMIAQARGPFLGMKTALYLYVEDVDAVYARALEQGGQVVFAPADMDYGDRQGGISDPAGNYWWISKRLEEKGYHE